MALMTILRFYVLDPRLSLTFNPYASNMIWLGRPPFSLDAIGLSAGLGFFSDVPFSVPRFVVAEANPVKWRWCDGLFYESLSALSVLR